MARIASFAPDQPGQEPTPRVEVRLVSLAAADGSVRVTTSFTHRFGTAWRRATWSFELAGERLTIESESILEGTPGGDEAFARALAVKLGWRVPPQELEIGLEAV